MPNGVNLILSVVGELANSNNSGEICQNCWASCLSPTYEKSIIVVILALSAPSMTDLSFIKEKS